MTIQSRLYRAGRLLFGGFVLSAAAAYSYNALAANTQQPIPRGVPMKSWQENGRDGRYLLQVIDGGLPRNAKRVVGTVLSDTDCDPDAEGLSHCHNEIQLPGGKKLTVIDSHNMHNYRCLGDGDRIALSRLGNTWVVGNLITK